MLSHHRAVGNSPSHDPMVHSRARRSASKKRIIHRSIREILMNIAWAMLALLWLALVSVIIWIIATAVARSR